MGTLAFSLCSKSFGEDDYMYGCSQYCIPERVKVECFLATPSSMRDHSLLHRLLTAL